MRLIQRARIALLGVIAGAALVAALPSTASAGLLVASAPDCNSGSIEQPFAQWGDDSDYFLAPGGDFEGALDGWQLNGRAGVTRDQEPWHAHGDGGSKGLLVPAGSSVVTPTICVGLEHPTIRLFAHRSGGGLLGGLSTMAVSVRFETSLGIVAELPIGIVTNGTQWNKTPAYYVVANLLPLLPGDHTPVQFRLTPVGTASWTVDDFYVDPRLRS